LTKGGTRIASFPHGGISY